MWWTETIENKYELYFSYMMKSAALKLFQIAIKWRQLYQVENKKIKLIRRIIVVDLPITEKIKLHFF